MFRKLKLKLYGRYKIPGTEIKANLFKQREHLRKGGLSYHLSYFDEEIVCRDCGEIFIYSAKDQKHYYEKKKGNIYAIGVRCEKCRAKRKRIKAENRLKQKG